MSTDLILSDAALYQVFDDLLPVHDGDFIAKAINSKRQCDSAIYHNRDMKTLAERLKEARTDRGLSQVALAKMVGIGQATVASIENGRNKGSTYTTQLAVALGVSPAWLADGIGEKSTSRLDINVSPASIGSRHIPIIDYVQAGAWTTVADPFPPGAAYEYVQTDLDLSGSAFALRVKGRSMAPEFSEGDVIIIDPSVSPTPGDFVVAKNGGDEATFKKYRPRGVDPKTGTEIFELVPLNEDFATIKSTECPCMIIGTMMEHRRYRRR